jgi:hypothetical protein
MPVSVPFGCAPVTASATTPRARCSPIRGKNGGRKWFVALRLSDEEYRLIAEHSRTAGLSRGGYLRAVALGSPGPRARRAPPINAELLAHAVAQLHRAGNNLNQVARRLNAAQASGAKESLEALAETRAAVARIVEAVGRRDQS